jgi:hypothetical protein
MRHDATRRDIEGSFESPQGHQVSCWRRDLSLMSCLVSLCLSFGGSRRHVATQTWSTKPLDMFRPSTLVLDPPTPLCFTIAPLVLLAPITDAFLKHHSTEKPSLMIPPATATLSSSVGLIKCLPVISRFKSMPQLIHYHHVQKSSTTSHPLTLPCPIQFSPPHQ